MVRLSASLLDRPVHEITAFAPLVEIVEEMEKARVSVYVLLGQRKAEPLSSMAFLTLKRMNARPKSEKPDLEGQPRWPDPASGRTIKAHGSRATFKT